MRCVLPFVAESFVKYLAKVQRDGFINPWAGDDLEATLRRTALLAHLRARLPEVILLTECATRYDAGVTGVPLVTSNTAASGVVPAFLGLPLPAVAPTPADAQSSEIWRALNLARRADTTLVFPIVPLIPIGPITDEQVYLDLIYWAASIIEWFGDIHVIAVGRRAGAIASAMQIPNRVLLPPGVRGASVSEQLDELIRKFDADQSPQDR